MSDSLPPRRPDPGRAVGAAPPPASGTAPREQAGGGPRSADRRALGVAAVAILVVIVIGALVGGTTPPGGATFPPVGATPGNVGSAAAVTRGEVTRALAAQGLQVEDLARPYRPAEAPAFATAPRIVVRVILPDDPDHGEVVIYEFADPPTASAAAEAQAAYIASGVGRVQFPTESRFVIRVVGSTAVFFTWSPAGAPDPRTASVAAALETLGVGVAVPG